MSFSLNGVSVVLENIVFIVTAEYTKLPLLCCFTPISNATILYQIYILCKPLLYHHPLKCHAVCIWLKMKDEVVLLQIHIKYDSDNLVYSKSSAVSNYHTCYLQICLMPQNFYTYTKDMCYS
jgi:hypothetical protein